MLFLYKYFSYVSKLNKYIRTYYYTPKRYKQIKSLKKRRSNLYQLLGAHQTSQVNKVYRAEGIKVRKVNQKHVSLIPHVLCTLEGVGNGSR